MIHLAKECILADMDSTSGEDALENLIVAVRQAYPQIDPVAAYAALMEREQIGSTGIGNGVAIPHGVIENLDQPVLCSGRSKKGVKFDAADNQPVYIFAGLFFPAAGSCDYLKILAWASRFFRTKANRTAVMEAAGREEIFELLKEGGASTG